MKIGLSVALLLVGVLITRGADRLVPWLTGGRSRPAGGRPLAVVGVFAAAACVAAGFAYGVGLQLAAVLAILAALIAVTVTDLSSALIPNRLLLIAVMVTAPLVAAARLQAIGDMITGALICGGIMLLVAVIARGGMGGGDVKLSAYIGLVLGWEQGLVALVLGVLLGGLAGIAALVTRRRGLKDTIPYGPYLAAGAALALLWGGPVIRWYLGL